MSPLKRFAIAGAIVIGLAGNLGYAPGTPLDKALNPQARNYWESEREFVRSIPQSCPYGLAPSAVENCITHGLKDAIDHGYLPRKYLWAFQERTTPTSWMDGSNSWLDEAGESWLDQS